MKKKILFIGITMNCAGSEKSFLSFVNTLDPERFEVDILLARREGLFLDSLPEYVNVIEMEEFGDHFLLSGKNAVSNIWNTFIKKDLLYGFTVLPYFIKLVLFKSRRESIATRMWIALMKHMKRIDTHYDVAVAYWGDRTMFYMIDRVDADVKITWLHFDYSFPKRDNDIYLPYFEKCDAIVNVSEAVDNALKRELPSLESRCLVIENINSASLIRKMAKSGEVFSDGFEGKRILTVGRIADQKGYDLAIPALARLVREGFDVKWYVLGAGDEDYVNGIKALAEREGVSDRFVFLGTTPNPYGYMKACDVYAQPSRYEGKPISVEEAKILAKPIFVCNYLSASEQLEGGEFGVIGEISTEGIYSGLKTLLGDGALAKSLSDKLSERVFSNESEIEKFYALL
jgi:glycosyltransferase involved in cell wall biosynthesis